MRDEQRAWSPLRPREAHTLLSDLSIPWWIAGGWAIDLFVGHQTRDHHDIDILILRKHQLFVQDFFKGWELHKTNQPGLKPWHLGEFLQPSANGIWCRRTADSPWLLDIVLMETDGQQWIFRREPRIRGPLSALGKRTAEGLPYLSPEIQLLYKARKDCPGKDEHDFTTALPLMDRAARQWLAASLSRQFPTGHEWLSRLTEPLGRTEQSDPLWDARDARMARTHLAQGDTARHARDRDAGPIMGGETQ